VQCRYQDTCRALGRIYVNSAFKGSVFLPVTNHEQKQHGLASMSIPMCERRNGKSRPQGYAQARSKACCGYLKSGVWLKMSLGTVGTLRRRREAHHIQLPRVTRLALDAQTNRRIRRRRPHGTLTPCWSSPSAHGTVLDVPLRLPHNHAGESPKSRRPDS
jgi:hypothetical protein